MAGQPALRPIFADVSSVEWFGKVERLIDRRSDYIYVYLGVPQARKPKHELYIQHLRHYFYNAIRSVKILWCQMRMDMGMI